MFEIIFVYNANSDIFSTITDFAHKILSPQTYTCNLCALTYGNFQIKTEWKNFLQTLNYPIRFLHRDQFQKEFSDKRNTLLPVIFLKHPGELSVLMSNTEINQEKSLAGFISLLRQKITEDAR